MTFGPVTIVRPGANVVIAAMGSQGLQGTPGLDGAPGAVGPTPWAPLAVWGSGQTYTPTAPASLVYINGSTYVCQALHTSGAFATDLANGVWQIVASVGPQGAAGTPGSTWYSGSGAPTAAVGANGDYFFRTDTYDVLLKVGGAWAAIANLKGLTGSAVQNGTGAPASSVGANGDFYLDTAAFVMYGPKVNGTWPSSGTSLVGPAGPGSGNVLAPAGGTVKPGQEVVFGVDQTHIVGAVRTPRGDASYSIQPTDSTVAITAALTAPRTFTLPSAASVAGGAQILVVDEAGGVSATNTVTLARAGTDTINSVASAVMAVPFGYLVLESDGASRWTIVDATATVGALGALAVAQALSEIAQQGSVYQLAAQQNLGVLTPGQVLAFAMTN